MFDRRTFMISGTVTLAGATLPPLAFAANAAGGAPDDFAMAAGQDYRALIGKTFEARAAGERLRLRLADVVEHNVQPGLEQMTLQFEETDGRTGPERTYALRQLDGGFDGYRGHLFLQPGQDNGHFAAAFSRFSR